MLKFWSEKRQAIFWFSSWVMSAAIASWAALNDTSKKPLFSETAFYVVAFLWVSLGFQPLRMVMYRALRIDKRLDGLLLGLLMMSTAGGAALMQSLRPISFCFVFYFLGWWLHGVYLNWTRWRKTKSSSARDGSPGSVLLTMLSPTYVPAGFRENQRNEYKVDDYTVAEITFGRDDSEYLIWLIGSTGDIPDYAPVKGAEKLEKCIREVPVSIEHKVSNSRFRRLREQPPFIQANWSYRSINFNLRTDGLSLQEVEKVITSMLH